ncbi:MAG TPA: stability determinant [Allosphingosinicella sp.]|nr:stability determinant [Allosphingosinicella sp.]
MNDLSPLVSEFATVEQAEAYLRWLEDKVAASKADGRPTVAHDEAMKRVRAIIEAKAGKA